VSYDVLGLLDFIASLFDNLLGSVSSGFSGFLGFRNCRVVDLGWAQNWGTLPQEQS